VRGADVIGCDQAALEPTGDNRASAAEMLGLSRQSLYVKHAGSSSPNTADEEGVMNSAVAERPSLVVLGCWPIPVSTDVGIGMRHRLSGVRRDSAGR
jgi:hypothetical protein